MKTLPLLRNAALACAFAVSCFVAGDAFAQTPVATAPGVSVGVYWTGFNNPRGSDFGPDPETLWPPRLYVAEAGLGGNESTASICDQVDPPIGPYTGSRTGSTVSVIAGGFPEYGRPYRLRFGALPSSKTSAESGALPSGIADIAFINYRIYMLIAGAGCSHGVASRDNGIVRTNSSGGYTLVANLSRWLRANPGRELGPDVEPDGTWYSMVARNGLLYVIEPNHGLFVRVNPATGEIRRLLDVSAAVGAHVVPTALAYHKGYFYIGNLGTFPIVDGTQRVWRVLTNPLRLQSVARATAIVGLAFDPRDDAMYILQLTTGAPGPTPGRGSILRLRPGGSPVKIVDGLTMPTAMTMAPGGGALYVSHKGFGSPTAGAGEVLVVGLP